MEVPEKDLVARARRKDAEAFAALIRTYERVALSIGASAIRQPPRPRSGSLARWVAALASCAIHAFLLEPLLLSSHVHLPVLKPARDPVAMELTSSGHGCSRDGLTIGYTNGAS